MNLSPSPYRPPSELTTHRRASPLIAAVLIWLALTAKVVVAGYFLRPMLADSGARLPKLTELLLHPMASVLFLATTSAIVAGACVQNSAAKRQRLGRIALALGLVALGTTMLGLIAPLVNLSR